MDALRLLTGDVSGFLEKVWGSHVHVHHADPAPFVGLLSADDVDHLLTSTALRTPALRIARDGQVLPASMFTRSATLAGQELTGLVDGRKVLGLFDEGASVVLQGLHRYWPPLTGLVRDLEVALGHPCQANAYLTPAGSQGFALHRDTHDVFVFQTHGTKRWEVHDQAGVHAVLLEPGVSMYLPAGTPHAARAQETVSLHVTIGINQVSWRDLLGRVVRDLLADPDFDGRLPAGYLEDPAPLADQLGRRLRSLASQLTGQDPDRVAAAETARFLSRRNPLLRGGLTDRLQMPAMTDDTVLRRRPGAVCVLVPDADRLRVLLGDRELRVPVHLETAMREVRDRDALSPSDLAPWLDPESRMVLLRRLVREGLLQVAG